MSEIMERQRIVDVATAYFLQRGFSKVTTDELAEELGMSKKTLYKHFATKEDILREAIQVTMHDWQVNLAGFMNDPTLSIPDKMRRLTQLAATQYAKISRVFLEDIRRNAPHLWKEINDGRNSIILNVFRRFVREGAEQGIFRADLSDQIIVLVFATTMQQMLNPDRLVDLPYSFHEIHEAVSKIFYEGILTDEGRRVMRVATPTAGFSSPA